MAKVVIVLEDDGANGLSVTPSWYNNDGSLADEVNQTSGSHAAAVFMLNSLNDALGGADNIGEADGE